jgi:hypothetical protein
MPSRNWRRSTSHDPYPWIQVIGFLRRYFYPQMYGILAGQGQTLPLAWPPKAS